MLISALRNACVSRYNLLFQACNADLDRGGRLTNRDRWNERYQAKELIWSSGPNETFAQEIGEVPPGKALDLGCGEGRNAIYLAERGWDVTAIDFSDVAIDKARQIADRHGVKVNWIRDDVSTWQCQPGRFDLVAVLFLHTHTKERNKWLTMATEAVAPGGIFVYIGHDPSNIEKGTGGPQDPDVLPGIEVITSHLTGFVIERTTIIERPVERDPGHHGAAEGQIALDALVRAVKKCTV